MLGLFGLISGLALLIFLAMRGVNIIFASILCSLYIISTNGLPLANSLSEVFTFGDLGAFTFAGKFFLLFGAGSIFGRVMSESHAATSIAMALVKRLGANRALWITVLASALLTYGGVVVFVVIFAMYPLGLRLLKEANIPKRLFCGALALGAGTFTLTALPGTPSILNVIPTVTLGTNLYAGAWLGLLGSVIMFSLGMWYLERERLKARVNGEGFVAGPSDKIPDMPTIEKDLPSWQIAIIPLVVTIGIIMLPRLLPLMGLAEGLDILNFAQKQPILWPSIALMIGCLVALLLFRTLHSQPLVVMGNGMQDCITPLMATSSVIGFGGVVAQTDGFRIFAEALISANVPPLLSMFGAVSMVSGITGSSSGGLQIFMSTMSESYLSMGIEPEELHRIVAMASGGFDSLPHCGAVIAILTVTQLTHKEAYKDIGIVTVVIPVIATLVVLFIAIVT